MQSMLLIHIDEAAYEKQRDKDPTQMTAAFTAYTQAIREAGVWKMGGHLHPASTATLVRHRDGKSQVLNGPYAEAKEQLGGYYILETADLEAAIDWAARCPGTQFGTVEVRPIFAM